MIGLVVGAFIVVFLGVSAALWFDRSMRQNRPLFTAENGSIFNGRAAGLQNQPITRPSFDFSEAAKRITPSVVYINTHRVAQSLFGDEFERPLSSGSGVIISTDGYILTNNHVVRDASRITVQLSDGVTYEAELIGRDPRSDIGLIKIEATGLEAAIKGDSQSLEVGDWVMAVGSPLGLTNSVSIGVVSSMARTIPLDDTVLVDAIQTDAAINEGNSGGALCSDTGELIGINTAIVSPNEGSIGLGFAIPIHRAEKIVEELRANGRVAYGWLGVESYWRYDGSLGDADFRQAVANEVGASNLPPDSGLLVRRVFPNTPGDQSGLGPLDVITKINGNEVRRGMDYTLQMIDKRPGEKVTLEVWSKGSTKNIELTLADQG